MHEVISSAAESTSGLSREAIAAELERILRSQRFLNSEGLREFLRFVVSTALDGNAADLKESVVAVEAFHRSPSFDPRLDSFVRVQAGRLRAALADYYESEGLSDVVLIEVPKGGYAPGFTMRPIAANGLPPDPSAPAQATGKPRPRMWLAIGLSAGLLLAAGAFLLYFYGARRLPPLSGSDLVVVADFENTSGDPVFDGTIRQALLIDLDQSPYLNILPEHRIEELRKQMARPAGEPLRGEAALELCRRADARAVLSGSVTIVGRLYVISLSADDCASGDRLLSDQVRAESKEQVLSAIDQAAGRLRDRLGESLANREKYSLPLESATTPSLNALQAYSEGVATRNAQGDAGSVSYFQRALELDPDFAMAYAQLGGAYFDLMKPDLAEANIRKAFALREHVSQRERYYIDSRYYHFVTAEQDKALTVYEDWRREFPRDFAPRNGSAMVNVAFGNYAAAEAGFRDALRLDPSRSYVYTNLAEVLICLKRPAEARALLDQMHRAHLEEIDELLVSYQLAFLDGNETEMNRQVSVAAGKPEAEEILLLFDALTKAGKGQSAEALERIHQASALAIGLHAPERAAVWQIQGALIEAEMGDRTRAIQFSEAALHLAPTKDVRTLAALALARVGDLPRSQALVTQLRQQYPLDTILNGYWLPSIAAASDLDRHRPEQAIEDLAIAERFQLGQPAVYQVLSIAPMYPIYLRGLAYRMTGKSAEAAAQFQTIVDRPELVLNYPIGALAKQALPRPASANSR